MSYAHAVSLENSPSIHDRSLKLQQEEMLLNRNHSPSCNKTADPCAGVLLP